MVDDLAPLRIMSFSEPSSPLGSLEYHYHHGVLQAAEARRADAERSLQGEQGVGRWQALVAETVGRRNVMVSELACAYQVGPSHPSSALDAAALERHIDSCWMAGGMDDDGDDREAEPAGQLVSSSSRNNGSLQRFPNGRGSPASRLSVVGLEIPPDLIRRILHDGPGGPGSTDEEQRIAAALGYMAHIVERLAAYLDVPLRYPLTPRMSSSVLHDPMPLFVPEQGDAQGGILMKGFSALASALTLPWDGAAGHPTGHGSGRSGGNHRASASGDAGGLPPVLDLPLSYDMHEWVADRSRFALAVHLMNKNVEQLLHVSAGGCRTQRFPVTSLRTQRYPVTNGH